MKSWIGTYMGDFSLSVPLRTELCLCILLTTYILRYILLLDVLSGVMLCFYSLFNQHSCHQVEDIVDYIFE